VGAGPETIGTGTGVLISTLGGTAVYTINSYGPCCTTPTTTTTTTIAPNCSLAGTAVEEEPPPPFLKF
jgi:hypothetical protein